MKEECDHDPRRGRIAPAARPAEGNGTHDALRAREPGWAPAAADEPPRRRLRILLIEDNADAREALLTVIGRQGHQVFEAVDGRTGVAAAAELRPEVASPRPPPLSCHCGASTTTSAVASGSPALSQKSWNCSLSS